ncbi:MAG: magnesium transporter [Eubacteriales bacterium]
MNEHISENTPIRQPDRKPELLALIQSSISPKALTELLSDYHDNDIADVLELLSVQDRQKLYRILAPGDLSEILCYTDHAGDYLNELNLRKRADVLAKLDAAIAAEYLKPLQKEERETILDLLPGEVEKDVSLLLSFDEDEIGSVMSTNYIEISYHSSIKEAMNELVRQAADNDNISTIYTVDENRIYYGAIALKDLIVAREGTALTDIITTHYPYLYAHELIEDCMERIRRYSEDSVPVLDRENRLLGVITAEDFIEVVNEELGEDHAKLAGLSSVEDLNESVGQSVAKRIPWLFVLLGLSLIVSAVVGLFESVVAKLTLVICFQSLVLDMAGNAGTQSLAVTIRVLTDEQLTGREKLRLVWKETRVGFINGLLLGFSSFAAVGLYVYFFKDESLGGAFAISACIGAALLVAMLLSSIIGTVTPLFFKKIHIDPAVASGPLITTMNDLIAVIAYYGLTWLFLIYLLKMG